MLSKLRREYCEYIPCFLIVIPRKRHEIYMQVARVRAWRLELFELFLPEQERTEHQQFWIINSETWKAFLTALAISNAPENDEKRR